MGAERCILWAILSGGADGIGANYGQRRASSLACAIRISAVFKAVVVIVNDVTAFFWGVFSAFLAIGAAAVLALFITVLEAVAAGADFPDGKIA